MSKIFSILFNAYTKESCYNNSKVQNVVQPTILKLMIEIPFPSNKILQSRQFFLHFERTKGLYPPTARHLVHLKANGNDFNRKETGSSSSRQWLSQCDGVNLKTILSKSIITSPLNALYLVSDVITYTLNKTIKLVFVLNSLLSKVQECCKVFGLLESSRSKVLNACNDYKVKDTMWFRLTNCIKKKHLLHFL